MATRKMGLEGARRGARAFGSLFRSFLSPSVPERLPNRAYGSTPGIAIAEGRVKLIHLEANRMQWNRDLGQ
jgi:hypothetical protein